MKPKLSKHTTMVATAEAAKSYLGDETIGDSRAQTDVIKKTKKPSMHRTSTMKAVVDEAKSIVGNDSKFTNPSSGRQLRTRKAKPVTATPAKKKSKKPSLKRAGTMQQTAKEGNVYLKNSK